jgi:hypothetical protein
LNQSPVAIKNAAGVTIGYSCFVSGTFAWLAAGAGWTTAIRVAAPASAPIGVDYSFYDTNGNPMSLDSTGIFDSSGNDVNFALFDNQPSEVDLLGLAGTNHVATTASGSVYAVFYCPDQDTCLNVLPQLIYSALPSIPWSLSVPIAWDSAVSATWSAVGIDDGGSHIVSFVVYNEDTVATRFTISVYNSAGVFAGSGVTPVLLPLQDLGSGNLGEGGTYGALLKNVVPNLPEGPFKVVVDGGPNGYLSAVVVLQFDGPSGTSLQVAYDSAPGSASSAAAAKRQSVSNKRVASTSKRVFRSIPR